MGDYGLGVGETGHQEAPVDEVKCLPVDPLILRIIDFKTAICWEEVWLDWTQIRA